MDSAGPRPWPGGLRGLIKRKNRYDDQPTDAAVVLLASQGEAFARSSVEEACRLAGVGPVAVVTVARMYGSSYGMPNPGLMPTRKEITTQEAQVARAVKALIKLGCDSSGQVTISRHPGKTIAGVARARGVRHIVIGVVSQPRWRRFVEGDPVRELRRRMGPHVEVHSIAIETKK